jgi:hypothetical protein
MDWDVFVSHASEDKEAVAVPLVEELRAAGLKVWFDRTEISLGDSLRRKIDAGLARSRYGVVIISKAFLQKEWPQKELDGLVARENGGSKVILPVRHEITVQEVEHYSPILAGKLSVSTSRGMTHVASAIVAVAVGSHGPVASPPASGPGGSVGHVDTLRRHCARCGPFRESLRRAQTMALTIS